MQKFERKNPPEFQQDFGKVFSPRVHSALQKCPMSGHICAAHLEAQTLREHILKTILTRSTAKVLSLVSNSSRLSLHMSSDNCMSFTLSVISVTSESISKTLAFPLFTAISKGVARFASQTAVGSTLTIKDYDVLRNCQQRNQRNQTNPKSNNKRTRPSFPPDTADCSKVPVFQLAV